MTYIGNANDEDDGGNGGGRHDAPNCPHKATARVGDTEEGNSNAALNEYSGRSIKELSNKEELLVMVSFQLQLCIQSGESTNLGSTADILEL